MQNLGTVQSHKSIFDTMLEECDSYEPSPFFDSRQVEMLQMDMEKDSHDIEIEETDRVLASIAQILPIEHENDQELFNEKDVLLQIKRVTSSRQEQEASIAQYFSSCKLIGASQGSKKKGGRQKAEGSKSLSPKKTKMIDKQKGFKILQLTKS